MEIIKGNLKIEWSNIGEGYSGDYDEDDPDDVNLLRFYISERDQDSTSDSNEFSDIDNGSYCTMFPADTTEVQQLRALTIMMNAIYPVWESRESIKRLAERCSWISPENMTILQV